MFHVTAVHLDFVWFCFQTTLTGHVCNFLVTHQLCPPPPSYKRNNWRSLQSGWSDITFPDHPSSLPSITCHCVSSLRLHQNLSIITHTKKNNKTLGDMPLDPPKGLVVTCSAYPLICPPPPPPPLSNLRSAWYVKYSPADTHVPHAP